MSGKILPTGSGARVSRLPGRRRVAGAAEIPSVQAVERVDAPPAEDVRLIVEDAGEPGQAIYLMVDRRTGQVIRRHTSEEVRRMREDADYVPGDVVDTKA